MESFMSYFSLGSNRINPVSGCLRKSENAALSSAETTSNLFSNAFILPNKSSNSVTACARSFVCADAEEKQKRASGKASVAISKRECVMSLPPDLTTLDLTTASFTFVADNHRTNNSMRKDYRGCFNPPAYHAPANISHAANSSESCPSPCAAARQ